jgi:hypothetical protein
VLLPQAMAATANTNANGMSQRSLLRFRLFLWLIG